ncbi:MAG: YraN family protein [Paludibacteraceae bacterium]|nr:YraN family protein [Paludibacteraceae bacterium]
MAWHNDIGRWGEDVAANLLVQKGYKIEARNWKEGKLEVDIIAADSQNIVFVEVKTRATMFAGKLPEEYVDSEKETNICRAAHAYIKQNRITKAVRFDIVSLLVDGSTHEISRLEHIEDAFYPPLRTVTAGSYSGQHRWQTKGKRRGL